MRRGLAAVLLLAACSREARVPPGATVELDYELSSGGALIESNAGREPLIVIQGEGALPGPVDEALVGMKKGEEKVVELTPMQGFGPSDPDKIKAIPLEKFGAMAKDLAPGALVGGAQGGKSAQGRVLKVENGSAALDFNHPLAGKPLRYKIKVVAIRAP
ncbi:MAG: FKBP-type peptidyl-prolyl cis-trans isomerase [Elusimicrobiota bacterium]|nr:FKBP-type peptidyl-prolyl cis-trans isomerase [Elusimicrobiota bacterium]